MTSLSQAISQIEADRGSQVLVLGASHLDLDLLPELHDRLTAIGNPAMLDLVLFCRGGEVGAARRIGLMLREATERLGILVPDRCQSAGTIVALAADELVAGPAAIFSPVDPLLQADPDENGGRGAISTEDVRRYGEMARAWFGQEPERTVETAYAAMSAAIFPPSLTAFYRAMREADAICRELLARDGAEDQARVEHIVSRLMFGYESHYFPISRDDLRSLGLPLIHDPPVEALAWHIAALIRASIGGGARATTDDDWFDACIATRNGCRLRCRTSTLLMPTWRDGEISEKGAHVRGPS